MHSNSGVSRSSLKLQTFIAANCHGLISSSAGRLHAAETPRPSLTFWEWNQALVLTAHACISWISRMRIELVLTPPCSAPLIIDYATSGIVVKLGGPTGGRASRNPLGPGSYHALTKGRRKNEW